MRRRNVPCSPCGSGSSDCGCCPPKSIKKINNIEPDDNGKFEVRAGTNITIADITNGIEISSAGSAEDVVKSVNGELPDQDGDVTIDTGVLTVNGVSPDADGDFTVSGGQNVTVTETVNGIEISASGGGWIEDTTYQWAKYRTGSVTNTDLILILLDDQNYRSYESEYIPSGTPTFRFTTELGAYSVTGSFTILSSDILKDHASSSVSVSAYYTRLTIGNGVIGSGADETIEITPYTNANMFVPIRQFKLFVRE